MAIAGVGAAPHERTCHATIARETRNQRRDMRGNPLLRAAIRGAWREDDERFTEPKPAAERNREQQLAELERRYPDEFKSGKERKETA